MPMPYWFIEEEFSLQLFLREVIEFIKIYDIFKQI